MPFFFLFFTKKSLLSCPYFVKKTSLLQKHILFMSIIVQKYVFFSKPQCFNFIFFKFFIENPCFYANIWSKTPTMSKPLYLSEKKSVGCLFRNFHEKPKKRPYFKKQTFLSQKNTSILSKTLCSHAICV